MPSDSRARQQLDYIQAMHAPIFDDRHTYEGVSATIDRFKVELSEATSDFSFMANGQMISRPFGDCFTLRFASIPADAVDDLKQALTVVASNCFPVKDVLIDAEHGIIIVEGDFTEIDAQQRP